MISTTGFLKIGVAVSSLVQEKAKAEAAIGQRDATNIGRLVNEGCICALARLQAIPRPDHSEPPASKADRSDWSKRLWEVVGI